jgi:hypothetical protein
MELLGELGTNFRRSRDGLLAAYPGWKGSQRVGDLNLSSCVRRALAWPLPLQFAIDGGATVRGRALVALMTVGVRMRFGPVGCENSITPMT